MVSSAIKTGITAPTSQAPRDYGRTHSTHLAVLPGTQQSSATMYNPTANGVSTDLSLCDCFSQLKRHQRLEILIGHYFTFWWFLPGQVRELCLECSMAFPALTEEDSNSHLQTPWKTKWKSSERTKLPIYLIRKSQIKLLKYPVEQARALSSHISSVTGGSQTPRFRWLQNIFQTTLCWLCTLWCPILCSHTKKTWKGTLKFSCLTVLELSISQESDIRIWQEDVKSSVPQSPRHVVVCLTAWS